MNDCYHEGLCGDRFWEHDGPGIDSLEALLENAGITEYVRFICGYHIQGQPALRNEFCALDWYAQDERMVEENPKVWAHYLILDQVSWGLLARVGRGGCLPGLGWVAVCACRVGVWGVAVAGVALVWRCVLWGV